jgi:hypothetical protein
VSVFNWGGRKPEDSSAASAAVATPVTADTLTTSKVFPRFMAALAHEPTPLLLDLGPVVGTNISFFGERLACKIFVDDLFADIESHARKGTRDQLAADLLARLAHEPNSIDGVLCWDLFDFLDKPTGQALATKLKELLRPGGAVYGLFGTTPIDLTHYTRFMVEAEDTLRLRPYPATTTKRNVMLTRDINKMFDGLTVAESVLLKTSTRETLFRKAGSS